MTVHARGYRTYGGSREAGAPALPLAEEGIRIALGRKAFRRIGVLYLVWFAIAAFFLYLSVGTGIGDVLQMFGARRGGAPLTAAGYSLYALDYVLQAFYGGTSFLTAMLAVFVGSGLVADDLQTGALSLYLVRPIRPRDYVLGKALVLPVILAVAVLLPGVLFYLLVGFWQPPGETAAFLGGNLDVLGTVLLHYVLVAGAYVGLTLLLSSRTPRRGAVAVASAAVLFAGILLAALARSGVVHGGLADILLLLDLPGDTVAPFQWRIRSYEPPARWDRLPEIRQVALLAATLFALGCAATWRRARSVELTS